MPITKPSAEEQKRLRLEFITIIIDTVDSYFYTNPLFVQHDNGTYWNNSFTKITGGLFILRCIRVNSPGIREYIIKQGDKNGFTYLWVSLKDNRITHIWKYFDDNNWKNCVVDFITLYHQS